MPILARKFPSAFGSPPSAQTGEAVDLSINEALKDIGQTIHDIPPQQLQALREQVAASLNQGRQVDPAALARKADFESLGMRGTQGQITRDPMQFAQERDLRGVRGVGEDLSTMFQEQGRALQSRMSGPAAGAKDSYNAGTQFNESLGGIAKTAQGHVSGLYGEARKSAGKDLLMPTDNVLTSYKQIVGNFEDKVPLAVQKKFDRLGFQFSFEDANSLRQVINDHVGIDPVTNKALGLLRKTLNDAQQSADAAGGPFAPAVKAASEWFKLQDAVPSLKAAANGDVAPDDFVRKFIVGGKTNEVKGLANVLKDADPAAWNEARAQIADTLKRAAFGENTAGDSPFRPTRYMEQIRRLGVDKIGAFFNAQEVSDLMTVGRVGSYIHQAPNASAPNYSGSAGAVMNMLARVPGMSPAIAVGNRVAGAVKDHATVRNALSGQVPTTAAPAAPLSDVQRNYLAYLLFGGAAGGGGFAGSQIGQ